MIEVIGFLGLSALVVLLWLVVYMVWLMIKQDLMR